jgi:hypothetical protein
MIVFKKSEYIRVHLYIHKTNKLIFDHYEKLVHNKKSPFYYTDLTFHEVRKNERPQKFLFIWMSYVHNISPSVVGRYCTGQHF